VNFLFFAIFFVLAAPMIFSLVRAKEWTTEKLGKADQPDTRI
jgi:hypothetical protein